MNSTKRTMDSTKILELTRVLIGEINPCGDCVVDSARYENLNVMIEVIDGLLADVEKVATTKDKCEFPMCEMGKRACIALNIWQKRTAKVSGLAQPEQKIGKWIHKIGMGDTWVCSECGAEIVSTCMGKPKFNQCPICGERIE